MASHEVWFCDQYGSRISDMWGNTGMGRLSSFTATRVTHGIGTFTGNVPASFDPGLLRRDLVIQVMRTPDGGENGLFRSYFLRRWEYSVQGGADTLELHGVCPNDLLRRRVVAAPPGVPESLISRVAGNTIGDAMKNIVSAATSAPILPVWYPVDYGSRTFSQFSVEGSTGDGPLPVKNEDIDVSYEKLFTPDGGGALGQLAAAAASLGTDIYYDVVPLVMTGSEMTYVFRTRLDQPGIDRTGRGVLFSQERGNLLNPTLTYDYSEEENYVYGVIEKGPYDTKIYQRYTKEALDASSWNRCEGVTDQKGISAGPYLRSKRPRVSFTGTITDSSGVQLGVDWDWGDRIVARYLKLQFNAIVKAVTITVAEDGSETIGSRLEYEENA
ncbi:MAG TPA: hypothetical protein VM537_02375 [Anaerolineae bacterium]|nr:hypothetical protein [Anaerolineae bacterium]